MKKKIWPVLLAAVFVIHGTGCETVQKKFTRKPKEPRHKPATVYIDQGGPYQKKYSNEYYYKTHFTFWTSWHEELLGDLDGNQKKMQRSAGETWNHLTEMSKYLRPEKQTELKPLMDDFEKIYRKIEKGNFRASDQPMFRSELEKIGRIIASNFYYDKVKDSLIPDAVDLGSH